MAIQAVSAFLFLLIPSLLQKEAVAPATPRFLLQVFFLGMHLPLPRTLACCWIAY